MVKMNARTRTCAVVPVKSLDIAKSKLNRVFRPEEKKLLVLYMLEDVVKALSHARIPVLVISPDQRVLQFANQLNCSILEDSGLGINQALELGRKEVMKRGFDSALLLPADLPLLRAWEIQQILEMGREERFVIISPTQRGGTGALYLRPPTVIPLRFEGESFTSHFQEALKAGLKPKIFHSTGTSLDLDTPEDIPRILALADGTKTKEFLVSLRL
jgi:2-phospho-L-lactate guanylyltransferase